MSNQNEESSSSQKVHIGGRDFYVSCEPDESEELHAAVDLLNSEITSLQGDPDAPSVSLETSAVIVALNLAGDLHRLNTENPIESDDEISSRIVRLIDKIDFVLDE